MPIIYTLRNPSEAPGDEEKAENGAEVSAQGEEMEMIDTVSKKEDKPKGV